MAEALTEVSANRLRIEDQNGEVIEVTAEYGQLWRDEGMLADADALDENGALRRPRPGDRRSGRRFPQRDCN